MEDVRMGMDVNTTTKSLQGKPFMPGSLTIVGTALLSGNQVIKNRTLVFEDKGTPASEFLENVYEFQGIRYPKFLQDGFPEQAGVFNFRGLAKRFSTG
jgi:hypothetical protein